MPTVREVTFNLLRQLDLTLFVGNPGSTEETFLKNFPDDFTYILALQEASVIGIADGLSQGIKKPVLVNVHTGAGMGNAMGCLLTAYSNKTPLIVTAGQQTREMLLMEPFLTNVDATIWPKPWVKWSYEPCRAEDIPGAFMRAYATAIQEPKGPVFLSLPLDDWDKEMSTGDFLRHTSTHIGPDPSVMARFIEIINQSKHPVLVYGSDIARSDAWEEGVAFAEKLNAPVWSAPFLERNVFPENHPLYAGDLPAAIGPLSQKLVDHDLIIVIGAPIFRYYPWVPGNYLPDNAKLLQITDSAYEAAKAVVGDSLICDSRLALIELYKGVNARKKSTIYSNIQSTKTKIESLKNITYPLTAQQLFEVLSIEIPQGYILVDESPSNLSELRGARLGTFTKPDSYYMVSSGGLGWGMPAAVGLAYSEKKTGRNRPVIMIIGDGSFQYSPQAIWTAVQQNLHIIVVVLRNEEYGILKSFARLENTPHVPGLDLPGLDIVSLGKGYGANTYLAEKVDDISRLFQQALQEKKVTVLEVPINKQISALLR